MVCYNCVVWCLVETGYTRNVHAYIAYTASRTPPLREMHEPILILLVAHFCGEALTVSLSTYERKVLSTVIART